MCTYHVQQSTYVFPTFAVSYTDVHTRYTYCIHYAGMMSKSKGQILRVAAALHVLFHLGNLISVSNDITDDAITAAINFLGLCCQQTAYMAGREDIKEEIQIIKACTLTLST